MVNSPERNEINYANHLAIYTAILERDPDAAEARARAQGHIVLESATDKPHGLREAYLVDPDGYCWVPDVPI